MRQYVVVIEKAPRNYAGYVPDLPGCVATGDTPDEAKENLREAVSMHLEGLREDNLPIPDPLTETTLVEVDA